ncbi:Nitrilotriacetate monooxygenase component B [Klebsiella pneumoniae IS46]|nr:Nitrilotriacetate monooxygenase component B [Klebsiella pneumoniae IS46]
MYFYQPSQGHGLPHDPLNAIIGPRPIGWIASQDAEGQRNLAPYSFFNCFNYRPPIIGFASSGWKDSVRNIVETKEFVWNLATRPLAMAMNERQPRFRTMRTNSCAPASPPPPAAWSALPGSRRVR